MTHRGEGPGGLWVAALLALTRAPDCRPIVRIGGFDPGAIAEQLEFLLEPAVDHVDGEAAAGDAVEADIRMVC
jgi:hypothetical protein